MGLNYRHGTGHGVGAALNVHEGPQSIAPRWAVGAGGWGGVQAPLKPVVAADLHALPQVSAAVAVVCSQWPAALHEVGQRMALSPPAACCWAGRCAAHAVHAAAV